MYGCTVIAQDGSGGILLVRHAYVDQDTWTLPGGGIDRGETPSVAAQRELKEELSCNLEQPRFYELEDAVYWGQRYVTCMITGRIEEYLRPDGREILEAAFFPPTALPARLCSITRDRIGRWHAQMAEEDDFSIDRIAVQTLSAL